MKKFKVGIQDELEIIQPMYQNRPEWYKKMPSFSDGQKKISFYPDGEKNVTIKHCMPFLDSLNTGYAITLMQDVLVGNTTNDFNIVWQSSPIPLEIRSESAAPGFPVPSGHSPVHYAWKFYGNVKLPKGYSMMITHPLNRFDLPFTTLSAVVDADEIFYSGNMPFFLKDGFEGIIPIGTPIAQMIPFKREEWKMELDDSVAVGGIKRKRESGYRMLDNYKNYFWHKKSYL
jgi:hypothetical protein